ncbi:hypothetical protein [Hydrogenophaga sp.]|uniref:hypothetical protein n=1 Tax=Hydrogenophaga sp. TaxID=1904254 RepID=UPI002AB96DE4|nr:hypothetical protein [Hydrogenophaga sp.]MDZ4400958.1 hypothetical protein [Hydrogenophaga sp.]
MKTKTDVKHLSTNRWTVLAACLLIATVLAINFCGDRYQVARDFVLSSHHIRDKHGSVRWYVVYAARSTFSWAGDSQQGSSDFRFYVSGSASSGFVHVRVVSDADKHRVQLEW